MFHPGAMEQFVYGGRAWEADSRTLHLHYRFENGPAFEEQIRFPGARRVLSTGEREALDRCFALVHLLAGVSYYKAAVPGCIRFEGVAPSRAMARLAERVFIHGLGEFAWVNGLDLRDRVNFPDSGPASAPAAPTLEEGIVVPLGGGKDSLVSLEALRSSGRAARVISVGQSALIGEVAQATGLEHLRIERRLSPELMRINREGALNGHVPISAILAAILAAAAILYGYDTIVMSNERSAEDANLVREDGFEVNHQYSKSLAFERDFQALLASELLPGLRYFSLLRPWSELAVTRYFAGLERYHRVFSSCNRNFRQAGHEGERWCRDCPKCRFVFLALAPFLPRDRLLAIFGGNLLDEPGQLDGFRELLGLSGHKPFECVGEIGESRSALRALTGLEAWREDRILRELGSHGEIREAPPLSAWLTPSSEHAVPGEFGGLIRAPG